MALQPFNYYFFSGAGTITVNGSAPASSYEEGTYLSIDVTFSDGSTAVEWIVNNASAGTSDPLIIASMPANGVYIRIIGTGAPVVDNKFRFFWRFGNGIGTLNVNGSTSPEQYYEAGDILEIETFLVPGFTFTDFNINNGFLIGLTNPYTFTMPAADVDITINSSGIPVYVDNHGLRYYSEFCDITGNAIDLQILEEFYEGESEKRTCSQVRYSFGSMGAEVLDVRVPSSISFNLIGTRDEFFHLLDGGNRYWKVRLIRSGDLFWEGYLSNQFLTVDEVGHQENQRFTAVDGMMSLDSVRAIESYFTRLASGFEMMKAIVRCINQTFDNARPSHVACSIYETRLDRSVGIFEQLLVPDNAVYEDGEQPVYRRNGGGAVELNTSLYIGEILNRMLKPFLCRLFLWKNEFYIISTPELNKPEYTLFNYDTFGEIEDTESILSGLDISCKFTQGQRTGKPVYTEFTTILKLGVLDVAARGGVIDYSFGNDDWTLLSTGSPYSGRYQLKNWLYKNAIPAPANIETYPTGSNAYIQFTGDGVLQIWGTTSNVGIADTSTAYIEVDSYRNKNPIQVAQGIANTLAFNIEFLTKHRGSAYPRTPPPSTQYCGVMIRVGVNYLEWDGNQTFSWTTTETVMEFPMINSYEWNTIDIKPIVIPSDGLVTVRLYQVINNGGITDGYTVNYRNMSLKIEQNEIYTKQDIRTKFITDTRYSSVYPPIETYIGDVGTDNSSSAIKLNIPEYNYPHSSLWSIDGTIQLRLGEVMLQEVANLHGKRNPRLIATVLWSNVNPIEIVPYQNVVYDAAYWIVLAIDLDFQLNTWKIELHQLGLIEQLTISWANTEYDEGGIFLDCNLRVYVNDVMIVEEFGTATGSLEVNFEDVIKVEYFYLDLSLGSPIDPEIRLDVAGVEVASHDMVIPGSALFDYEFIITENTTILVYTTDNG